MIYTISFVKKVEFKRSIISQPYYVSFTDNLSVPQTMDYSVNQGFAKLVSSTDNSSSYDCGYGYRYCFGGCYYKNHFFLP